MLICPASVAATPAKAQQKSEIETLVEKYGLKQGIIKPPSGLLKREYLVPSGRYYQLFDWDTYFMGVALSYDGVGQPLADSVKDFLDFTDEHAAYRGYTPREISPDAVWALPEMCKPFLAQEALRASLTAKNFDWLKEPSGATRKTYYQKLADTLSYWENARRSKDGLFRWYDGVESGVDNNPAVSDNPPDVTEGVDLQCYLYREYLAIAILADKLAKPDDAQMYRERAKVLAQLVRKKMWSKRDGMFLNIDSRTGKFVRIKTWTNFVPLWVGIATNAQAKQTIREHLLNPNEFWSPNGIRTISKSESFYNPRSGYWRGPVWVISDYLLMHGLMNYGYRQQAEELARKTVALLVHDLNTTGGMDENYDPETGAPDVPLHFVSWDLLGEHMQQEASENLDPTEIRGE